MYAIDLFCGAGGFSEGILQAGFHIVFSSDRSPYVQKTYMNRHEQLGLIQDENTHFELADIKELQSLEILNHINNLSFFRAQNKTFAAGDIDAIFGGPPCQGFSVAGKRDVEDPRNMLFREYLRIIHDLNPKYVVMENVTGFLSMQVNPNFESFNNIQYEDNSLVCDVVKSELSAFGYTVLEPRILNASDYGVPQNRQRAIFLAYRNDVTPLQYPEPTTPELHEKVTVFEALAGISVEEDSDYALDSLNGRTPHFLNGQPIANLNNPLNTEESVHSKVIVERFSLFNQGESIVRLKKRLLQKKLNKEVVIDFKKLPNLLLETTFNLNSNSNLEKLRKIVSNQKLFINTIVDMTEDEDQFDKFINSLYKQIKKLWNSNDHFIASKNSYVVYGKKITSETMKNIVNLCKMELNTSPTSKDISIWFLNKKYIEPKLKDEDENSIWKIGENEYSWKDIANAVFTNKNTRVRLDGDFAGPTMVTLPDDFIHPTLNKILNVREMARIQSFDDSFEFLGKRTTGGKNRKNEVPQFTQVGNAVPPLLAKAIALEVSFSLNNTFNLLNLN